MNCNLAVLNPSKMAITVEITQNSTCVRNIYYTEKGE